MDDNTEKILMIIPIGAIAFTGTLSNGLSLFYFIRRENASLWTRLFILLNSLDFVVCVTSAITVVLLFWGSIDDYGLELKILRIAFFFFLDGTAFATCVLSFTRMLAVCKPYYTINGKAIGIATTLFLLFDAVVPTVLYFKEVFDSGNDIRYLQSSCTLFLIIIVVVACNVASVVQLLRCEKDIGKESVSSTTKKATITVAILSGLFCFFNIAFAFFIGCNSFDECEPTDEHFKWFIRLMIIPLNSALNPVVYFIRKKNMRVYVKEVFYSCFQPKCQRREQ